jgi:prevent-host-death family protein
MDATFPITEARAKMKEIAAKAHETPVVLLSRSRPVAVVLSPERYQAMLDRVEELEDQAAILYDQLHPEERISHEKVLAELGLMA